ncbi:MAG: hypothetical protein LBH91_06695 [Prevotellaceae bacterium]|jgi:shikimate dehydrogenase|nr:hypothetical protein [Prevotellaceae bacterium]
MKQFALTGISIAHSRSLQLFEAAYHGKYTYELMPATTVAEALRMYEEKGLSGMNITTPFKEAIIPYIDIMNEDVCKIGAANIVFRRNNCWMGHNSDVHGVVNSLRNAGINLFGADCLVLGWGGAGRAATLGLLKAGARVTVANRTVSKVEAMSAFPPVETLPLDEVLKQTEKYTVLVNALPVLPELVERIRLYPHHVLLEADYTCGILRDVARNAGTRYLSGLQWLLYQAIPAFRLFTNEEPDVAAMQLIMNKVVHH